MSRSPMAATTRWYATVAAPCGLALIAAFATSSGVRAEAATAASIWPSAAAPVVPAGEVHSPAEGLAKATAMVSLVALPAGSTTLPVSPTPDLATAQSTGSDNFIDVPAFYSVPVTDVAFATYLKTLTVAGFSPGLGTFGGKTTMKGFVSTTVGF